MSRHTARRSEPWLISVAFAAVLAAVVGAFTSFGAPASEAGPETGPGSGSGSGSGSALCSPREVRLDAAPEISAVLQEILDDKGCAEIIVGSVPSGQVLANLVDRVDVPDLWIPDSTSWVARLGPAGADVVASVVAPSLATSPVVIASTGATAASWAGLLGDSAFVGGDPLSSTTAAVPLLGARAEQPDQQRYAGMLVPVAQKYAGGAATVDLEERLDAVLSDGGATVASEQAVLAGEHDGLDLGVPSTGTAMLDYPLVVSAVRHRAKALAAADWLTRVLAEPEARAKLAAAGFRGPDAAPLPDRGVGAVSALEVDPATVPDVLRLWARLALPTRALAVFDVSGSMGFAAGRSTRMALTTGAARAGVGLFPDVAAIGLWQFSQELDGGRDHEPLLPIRRLDEPVGSGDHRDALVKALNDVAFIPGTATGLYDTVLAAFKEVQSSYDPQAVNSVILFTDGRNEDPGSMGLQELLAELKKLQKPTRPVAIITIGISADADVAALRRISATTGGTSYVAKDPQDIGAVFRQALSARVP